MGLVLQNASSKYTKKNFKVHNILVTLSFLCTCAYVRVHEAFKSVGKSEISFTTIKTLILLENNRKKKNLKTIEALAGGGTMAYTSWGVGKYPSSWRDSMTEEVLNAKLKI